MKYAELDSEKIIPFESLVPIDPAEQSRYEPVQWGRIADIIAHDSNIVERGEPTEYRLEEACVYPEPLKNDEGETIYVKSVADAIQTLNEAAEESELELRLGTLREYVDLWNSRESYGNYMRLNTKRGRTFRPIRSILEGHRTLTSNMIMTRSKDADTSAVVRIGDIVPGTGYYILKTPFHIYKKEEIKNSGTHIHNNFRGVIPTNEDKIMPEYHPHNHSYPQNWWCGDFSWSGVELYDRDFGAITFGGPLFDNCAKITAQDPDYIGNEKGCLIIPWLDES